MEIRPIPSFPGYFAGDDGSIWSDRSGVLRTLKQGTCKGGYKTAAACGKTVLVHRLVLMAFVGPCPPDMEAAHKNGKPADNRRENLRWSTRYDQYLDKLIHGTAYQGERVHAAKLTSSQVHEIRDLLAHGLLHKEIAARFGVKASAISNIATGRSWRSVEDKLRRSLGRTYKTK